MRDRNGLLGDVGGGACVVGGLLDAAPMCSDPPGDRAVGCVHFDRDLLACHAREFVKEPGLGELLCVKGLAGEPDPAGRELGRVYLQGTQDGADSGKGQGRLQAIGVPRLNGRPLIPDIPRAPDPRT